MNRLRGLTSAEAARRLAEAGRNELPTAKRRSPLLRIAAQFREPMNVLLLSAAAVSGVALGERLDALAIGTIVAINVTITLAQEGRANRALAALQQLTAPEATVVRDGVALRVAVAELVPGDVVRLSAGDRVPADGRIVEADLLEIDESILSGESVAVAKQVGTGDETEDIDTGVLQGTFVTHGSGSAVVGATGAATQLGGIAASLDAPRSPTPLQRELTRLSQRLGIAAVVIAGGVFVLTLVRVGVTVEGFERSFLSAVALAVAAVPEGLPTVTLVALAAGVRQMARHRAIVRRLPAVETLGSATVIVTDKTGTITENRMSVAAAWSLGASSGTLPEVVASAARCIAAVANDATLEPPIGDPMELALLEFAGPEATRAAAIPRVRTFPVDSDRMRMSVVTRRPSSFEVCVKGAPESVVGCCVDVMTLDGGAVPLTDAPRLVILEQASRMASSGARVLALARAVRATVPAGVDDAESSLTFVALVALEDPARPGAADAVAAARAAGIRIVMATGDHPATAQAIARSVGLPGSGRFLTGAHLARDGLPADPLSIRLYARVDPSQKLRLVQALQQHGEVVAMTGDGVNDAPALRHADIGIALGQRGSDVAREAADMVVTDDDLATIVVATREGRGIYDNIRKVVDYLVAGNLSEVVVVVGALLALPMLGVPLLPLQLLWVNLLTDGLPALALGNDRHDRALMLDPPRSPATHLLDRQRLTHLAVRGALMAAPCLAAGMVVAARGEAPDHVRTVILTTLVVTHLLYAFVARQPTQARRNGLPARRAGIGSPWLVAAVTGGLALHLAILLWSPAQRVFRTTTPTLADWQVIAVGALAALCATIIYRHIAGSTSLSDGKRLAAGSDDKDGP